MEITHLGTATLLLETGGVRILTDPAFDPAGTRHSFAPLFPSTKTYDTPRGEGELGPLDAVLLTHDQHGDNLDAHGRALLANAPRIVTTRAAKRRLGKGDDRVVALAPFESTRIGGVEITATPARHGPPLSLPFVGSVIGFVLRTKTTMLYMTGDTVFYGGLRDVAARFDPDVVVAHLGAASWGPFRFTMNAREARALAALFPRARIVPVHYEGWTHFAESRGDVEAAFAAAPDARERLRWLEPGVTDRLP